jgi:diacylglycerol kinase (ATP)
MGSEILVIVNNFAARAPREWPALKRMLEEGDVKFRLHQTLHAGDATNVTRVAVKSGIETVVVVGGDGTISEVAEGFFEMNGSDLPTAINPNATLAIIPAGTGNDFARGLISTRSASQGSGTSEWARRIIMHYRNEEAVTVRPIDTIYGCASDAQKRFVYVNVATLGIGPEVAKGVSGQSRLFRGMPGAARFLAAACGALVSWRERELLLSVDDGEQFKVKTNLLAVANSSFAGGGMQFAPNASIDDGSMDLMIAADLNRRGIVRELPRIRSGRHVENPKVSIKPCKRVVIENMHEDDPLMVEADGNLRGTTPVEFRIMTRSLCVLV